MKGKAWLVWVLLALGAGLAGVCSVLVGLLVPVYHSAVDVQVVAAIPDDSTMSERIGNYAQRGEVALARRLHRAGSASTPQPSPFDLPRGTDPALALAAGGPAPFWLETIRVPEGLSLSDRDFAENGPAVALSFLTRRSDRQRLVDFSRNSVSPVVNALDAAARAPGWSKFGMVGSGAEGPLLAAAGLTAMLSHDRAWPEAIEGELVALANRAANGDLDAVATLEPFFLATLGLARELSYAELRALARTIDALEDWSGLRKLLLKPTGSELPANLATALPNLADREQDVRLAAVVVHGEAAPVLALYADLPLQADAVLAVALATNPAALAHVLGHQEPLWPAPEWWPLKPANAEQSAVLKALTQLRSKMARLTARHAWLGWGLHWAFLALGGGLLVLAIAGPGLLEGTTISVATIRLMAPGMLLAIAAQLILEPELLTHAVDEPGNLQLDFAATMLETETPVVPSASLDQTTILVLTGFFALQLLLYGFSLMKLGQIRKTVVPPSIKLRLLDNEEHLFDAGLYVGLSGTVISLVMLAMGIVQASLVAAYASTLFGIIFVAILKIFHLRPLKRQLLMAAKPTTAPSQRSTLEAKEAPATTEPVTFDSPEEEPGDNKI